MTKFSPSFVWRHWNFQYMAAGGHSNMAAFGNNKTILWSPQNSLVIFTFKVVYENILVAFLNLFRKPRSMICLQISRFDTADHTHGVWERDWLNHQNAFMLLNNNKSRVPGSPFIYTLQLIGPISWMHSWENNAVLLSMSVNFKFTRIRNRPD